MLNTVTCATAIYRRRAKILEYRRVKEKVNLHGRQVNWKSEQSGGSSNAGRNNMAFFRRILQVQLLESAINVAGYIFRDIFRKRGVRTSSSYFSAFLFLSFHAELFN